MSSVTRATEHDELSTGRMASRNHVNLSSSGEAGGANLQALKP